MGIRLKPSLADILQSRQRDNGLFVCKRVSRERLALATVGNPKVKADGRTMSATVTISTEAKDRSKDIVLTKGIQTHHHEKMPVVLLEHGLHHKLPIGKARGSRYTVQKLDGRAVGTTYFAQDDLVAEQVFGLIDQGVLLGASIGFKPLRYKILDREDYDPDTGSGLFHEETELLEYSHCVLPDNPECCDAAGRVLHKSVLCGRSIDPVIRKSLLVVAPAIKTWGNGWTPSSASTKGTTMATRRQRRNKAYDEDEYVPMDEEGNVADDVVGDDDLAPPVDAERKPGAQALERAYDLLMEALDAIGEDAESQENPTVTQRLEDIQGKISEVCAECAAEYAGEYPDYEPLAKDDMGTGGMDGDELAGDETLDEEDELVNGTTKSRAWAKRRLKNTRGMKQRLRTEREERSKLAKQLDRTTRQFEKYQAQVKAAQLGR